MRRRSQRFGSRLRYGSPSPFKSYVATVTIAGKTYRSEPTDLSAGVNVVPVKVGELTRYVPVGSPATVRPYRNETTDAR